MTWHTIEQITDHTFRISEPFGAIDPSVGVDTANMYLLVGSQRCALVDTGMGIGDLASAVRAISDLPCEVLNTHHHWDHVGANDAFEESAIHALEADALPKEQSIASYLSAFRNPADPSVLPPSFDVDSYRIVPPAPTRIVHDGARIDLGGRMIEALHTPGHSPGHTTYLDRAKGLLFTGDTAYHGPVFACFEGGDPEAFAATAARLAALPGPVTVCPGHNAVIDDPAWLPWYAQCVARAVSGGLEGELRDGRVRGREFQFGDLSVWLPA